MVETQEKLLFYQVDFDGLNQRRDQLAGEFSRSLDLSLIKSICYDVDESTLQGRLLFLGEGSHCRSFWLKQHGSMDLSISIAYGSFKRDIPFQNPTWTDLIAKVTKISHPLIPPMAVLKEKNWWAYVQPYCPQSIADLPLSIRDQLFDLCTSLERELARNLLRLDDYFHIRGYENHPFVIDWSDLKRPFSR